MPEEKGNELLVVQELPQIPTRVIDGDDGKTYDLVTLTEAVKEILEKVRVIEDRILKI